MVQMNDVAMRLAQAWGFEPIEELPGGHCSRIYADANRVLKVPFQGEEMTSGFRMMSHLAERGCTPKLFHDDAQTGAILMERIKPALCLHQAGLTDDEQREVWKSFVARVRATGEGNHEWAPLDQYINRQDRLADHLVATSSENCNLHGDLHHENILLHGDHWVCIDPKGLYGDPAFEGAAYVRNPLPSIGDFSTIQIEKRVHQVASSLNVDPFRVWGWSVTQLRDGDEPTGPWRNVLARLNKCAPAFNAEQWVLPMRSIE